MHLICHHWIHLICHDSCVQPVEKFYLQAEAFLWIKNYQNISKSAANWREKKQLQRTIDNHREGLDVRACATAHFSVLRKTTLDSFLTESNLIPHNLCHKVLTWQSWRRCSHFDCATTCATASRWSPPPPRKCSSKEPSSKETLARTSYNISERRMVMRCRSRCQ